MCALFESRLSSERQEYGYENPRDFLTLRVNGVNVLPQKEVMNFARYLGRGLHNRSLYGIMRRFRCIYDTYKKGRLSDKEKNVLERHVKLYGREYSVIRKVFGKSKRSIESCADVVKSAYKAKSFKSDKEKSELFKAILEVTGSENYEELQGKRIDWQEVGKKLEVSSESCKHYWNKYLHGYITLKKPLRKTDVHCQIIDSLKKMDVESSKAVDWNKVSEDVHGLPSAFLWNVFADLCHAKKIKYTDNHWKAAMETLSKYYYPAAKADGTMSGVFPVYQPKNCELYRVH